MTISLTILSPKPWALVLTLGLLACNPADKSAVQPGDSPSGVELTLLTSKSSRLDIYKKVSLNTDLSHLSQAQRDMLKLLIEASSIMDDLFWRQAFGDNKEAFLATIADPKTRQFADINYGPWDRLDGDDVFLSDTAEKSLGAQFYPPDMTKAEFEQANFTDKKGLYSMVKRDAAGKLFALPYSEAFKAELTEVAALLEKAALLAEDQSFAQYLQLRAKALLTNDYQASDFAWMDMKTNPIELVIGPIETYEDQLFGYRAAFEAYVLIKDLSWSERLSKYAAFLPELQTGLPVAEQYKAQMPGTDADLNAYDVIYYAGHSNAGSKTIAINLPNDEEVQLQKGTRRLQLKNAMQAKFDNIMLPIADELIVAEQRKHITFTAFFANTMFHEVAHGLGIKTVLGSEETVRQALKEHASALEEGKADILGIYMVKQLLAKGVITEGQLEDYYVTFMAGIFRSVRFGASSAHGKANMIRFNFFNEHQAFSRNEQGLYQVNMDKMSEAVDALSNLILTLQGDGNYDGVNQLVADKGIIKPQLAADLERLTQAAIPVDIDFEQGIQVLGL
ncbi:dipeptidyl-peptidase 3 family protein [Paraglaciecola hydrolytica]|uniref:Zn-dependent hydrolase n=1 Tax=Paraglaciecola hydrolytica TaxID=1799789 RepID=A0A136A027_9ALTE|nr:Zn-dependent hydrolase [Paraglaciecola hydrolytica]KXI28609.1 Zn-dependent hydrolase [Paraglaciecola hydrolytica]